MATTKPEQEPEPTSGAEPNTLPGALSTPALLSELRELALMRAGPFSDAEAAVDTQIHGIRYIVDERHIGSYDIPPVLEYNIEDNTWGAGKFATKENYPVTPKGRRIPGLLVELPSTFVLKTVLAQLMAVGALSGRVRIHGTSTRVSGTIIPGSLKLEAQALPAELGGAVNPFLAGPVFNVQAEKNKDVCPVPENAHRLFGYAALLTARGGGMTITHLNGRGTHDEISVEWAAHLLKLNHDPKSWPCLTRETLFPYGEYSLFLDVKKA